MEAPGDERVLNIITFAAAHFLRPPAMWESASTLYRRYTERRAE